jgi:hypothetical protein
VVAQVAVLVGKTCDKIVGKFFGLWRRAEGWWFLPDVTVRLTSMQGIWLFLTVTAGNPERLNYLPPQCHHTSAAVHFCWKVLWLCNVNEQSVSWENDSIMKF